MKDHKRPYFSNKGSTTSKNFGVLLRILIQEASYYQNTEHLKIQICEKQK